MTKVEGRVVLLVAVLGTAALVAMLWDDVFRPLTRADEDDVKVALQVTTAAPCDPDRPVLVGVRNGSRRTVKEIEMAIEFFERGDSKPIGRNDEMWTRIVAPGEISRACLPVGVPHPVRTADADYQAFLRTKTVRFYGASEAVPK